MRRTSSWSFSSRELSQPTANRVACTGIRHRANNYEVLKWACGPVGRVSSVSSVKVLLGELDKPGLVDKFIAHALPADFVPQLIADRDALINFRKELGGEDQTGVISTAAISRLMRAGMKEVKYLDAIVRNTYRQNPDHLRAWESASTVERPPRRKKQAAIPTAGAAPAAPAASS